MPKIDFSGLPDKEEVPQGAIETPEVGSVDFSGLPDKGESGVGEFEGKIPTVAGAPIAIGIDKSQRIDKGKILSLPVTNIGIDKKKMRDAFTDAATLSTLTGRKVSPSVAYKYRESLDKKANELQDTWGQVFLKAGLAVGPSTMAGAAGLVREAEEFIQQPLPHEEFPEISLEGYKGPIPTRTTFGEEAGAFWAKKLKDIEIKSGDNTLKRYAGLITTNVLQNLPLLGIGAITGGSTIPLVAMGVITKGRKYQEMRDRGMDDSTARLMSTVVGVSEAATEKLGFDALIKSGIPFAKRLLLASGLDVPGELINTSIEAVVDKVSIDPGMTYEEYVSALIDTAIVSLGSAGALTSISHPLVLMREQQEQRDKSFAEKQQEDTVIKGEEQDTEFKEGFGIPELPEELQGAYEEARMEAIEQGKSEDEATSIALEAVSQTEEGKAYIDTVQQAIQPEPAPTLEETFGRITEEDLTDEELGAQFKAFAAGREIIGEEFPVSAPVAEIKQRLLDTGMNEEEAQTNAAIMGGFQSLAQQAGVPVEVLMERYLPEVVREDFAPIPDGKEVAPTAQEGIDPVEPSRGRFIISPDGVTIKLFETADASTFVHETGHLYFRMISDLSTLDTASDSLKADFETIRDWLGVPEGAEAVSVDQQEQFARGFEAYLREGVAPTPALAQAFENFKQWLMDVYKSLLDLDVTLTDDVRGVFDRLLAEEGVDVAPAEEALEQAPIKKDLQSIFGNDTFNVEEIERRIENGLYVTDIIPEEARTKAQGSNIEAGSSIAKESLRSVRQEDASDFSRIENPLERKAAATEIRNAEVVALRQYAEENDLVLPGFAETLEKEGNRGGTENLVYRDKSTGRWMKANFFTHTPTFSELFDRIMIHNVEFESEAYQLEGFAEVGGEFLPVFSQEHIQETEIIDDGKLENLASDTLELMGYVGESDFIGNVPLTKFISPEGVAITDINSRNVTHIEGDVAFIDPVIAMDAETKEARVRSAIEEASPEVLEQAVVKPRKVPVKTRVRKITGQVKDKELRALEDEFVRIARVAREAFKAGKDLSAVKEARKLKNILARSRKVRLVRDYFALTDADMKKIAARNPVLMSQWEFKQYLDDVRYKSAMLSENKLQKASLIQLIYEKDLGHTDNYRRVLNLPPVSQMTTDQVQTFAEALEHYHDGDVFLSERELETVDRTDLAGIATWREAKERLSEEIGVSIEELETIKVKEWDDYKWDTSLAESNPFYKMLVTETTRKLLEADLRVHEIENQTFELARKSEASQNRTLAEKAVPSDPQIMDYIEALPEEKELLAEDMTKEQLDYAHYIQSYFQVAREYLIKTKSMERGRENYFVHVRKTFLENVKDKGLLAAFRGLYQSYVEDEATFNIMDDDTGDILPLEKFFQFAMQRTGGMEPTTNVTRAFLVYVNTMEKKISLDELIPKMDIYAQSITPQIYTPRGLEIDRSLKKFVNKFINNKKGRRIRWIAKQGGVIDVTIRGLRTFTTMLDLGLSIPTGVAAFVGEQAANFEMLGTAAYVRGNKRINTKKGKVIIKKYEAFIGRSAWEEFTAPGKQITERISTGLFGLFHEASVLANKQFLLGTITPEEYNSGELSAGRLAEIKIEMGRFRVVPGTKSLVGSTSAGSAMMQYKTWAAPIIRTLSKDLTTLATDIKNKPAGEALTTREAREIYRFLGATFTVIMMGAIASSHDDDDSFTGQLLAKVYRESMTLLQSTDPTLWARAPRLSGFLFDLSKNLKSIAILEEYKTKPGLKGVQKLQRQFTPRAIKQFQSKEKKRR